MSLRAALTDKLITVSPNNNVEQVLKEMKKANLDTVAVIDEDGKAIGLFSLQSLMKGLLPVSVAMNDGIQLDVKISAAPGIAKRLNKIHNLTINESMERKFSAVNVELPLWEAVNELVTHGSPLLVVDGEEKPVGMITSQSALDELTRMKDLE